MPSAFDLLDSASAAQQPVPTAPVDDSPGQFQRGLRSGLSGARSQLDALAGGAAEAAGAEGLARNRYEAARAAQAEAEASAPNVTSYKDVHDLRSGYDYVTGLVGQSIPQAGAAVAGGLLARTPVGRAVGATLATAPFEAGDIVQRQQNDPTSLRAPATDRFGQAVSGGLASAGVQAVLPASVAGHVAEGVAGQTVRQAVGNGLRTLPTSMALGGAGGAGEAIKQGAVMLSDPSRELDPEAIKEATVGGVAAGGALHGVGVAADVAHAGAAAPGNTLSGVLQAGKDKASSLVQAGRDKLSSGADSASAVASDAGKAVKDIDPVDTIRGLYDKGTTAARDMWDSVAKGEDPAAFAARTAGLAGDKLREAMPTLDAERVQQVKEAATSLMDKAGLDEGRHAQLAQAMGDLSDRGNQAVVGTIKKGWETTQNVAGAARDLYASFKGAAPEADGVKKSEDFSGISQALREHVVPAMERANPGVFDDPKMLHEAANGVRLAVDAIQKGGTEALSTDQRLHLFTLFGNDTTNVLDAVHKALGGANPAESEKFYGALNEMRMQQREQDKTLGLMQRSLLPDLQDTTRTSDVRRELNALRTALRTIDDTTARGKFQMDQLKFELDKRYGNKADAILEAVRKEQGADKSNVLDKSHTTTDEDGSEIDKHGHGLSEQEAQAIAGKTIYYGPQKGGLALHPDLDPAGEHGQAIQALARARKENPDKSVSFLSAKDLGHDHPDVVAKREELINDFMRAGKSAEEATRMAGEAVNKFGVVAAEGSRDHPGRIDRTNIRQVMVASKEGEKAKTSHREQPSVFKADGVNYDAIALMKMMREQFKGEQAQGLHSVGDEKGDLHRSGRLFQAGIAALQDHLGKSFEVPDHTVIDHDGTTFGMVKKLDYSPENKAGKALDKQLDALRKAYKEEKDPEKRAAIRQQAQDAIDAAKITDPSELQHAESGFDADPFGNVHESLGGKGEAIVRQSQRAGQTKEETLRNVRVDTAGDAGGIHVDMAGASTAKADTPITGRMKPAELAALQTKFETLREKAPSAAAKAIAGRGLDLVKNADVLPKAVHGELASMLNKGTTVNGIAERVNALHERYKGQFKQEVSKTSETVKPAEATKPVKPAETVKPAEKAAEAFKPAEIDKNFAKESHPEFKTKAEADGYLLDAYKRWGELAAEDRRVLNDESHPTNELPKEQSLALSRLSDMFASDSRADLGSFYPENDMSGSADTAIRAMLRKAAPEVAAQVPKALRNAQATGTQRVGAQDMHDIRAYVDKVLGSTVKTALANIPHAGEFVNDTIRISVHALNPRTVAYHEALHAFFSKLTAQGNSEVARALERAATSAPILNQLRKLLANEHAALAQLRHPEEAAAYMYQFWAAGALKVGDRTKGFFERVRDAVARVLGVWTADQRAERIMDYFHSGEFQTQGLGKPNAVARALLESGRNQVIEHARTLTKPLVDIADALSTAGGQRLRDTGIPALRELADMMKATGRDSHEDAGFVPAARTERTRVMNELAQQLRGFTQGHMEEALEAMQSGATATSKEARTIQRIVQGPAPNALLPSMLKYMGDAGVDVSKIQPRDDYFPRLYDAHYISRHQEEFAAVLERHGLNSKDAQRITQNLMATNGSEFTVETNRPGMQFTKRRELAMIPDAELSRFMRKNMMEILSSYVTQATRRAEWARRAGDEGERIGDLLAQAKKQGADDQQLATADKFIRAVDGTLGDDLSPTARRVMGNAIVYQNLRLLPLAIFSSVIDPLGIMVRGGTVRDAWSTFTRGMREIPASFKGEHPADGMTHLAETLGVIDDAMLADATGQLYTQGLVGDSVKKINDTFFRFNLMEGFNRSMRVGATQAAIKFLERHQDGTASPHSARWLAELGLKPGFKMDTSEPAVRAAINSWVDGAVLRPDAVDKPLWMSDPHYMLFSHLKQFVYSFQETILKRVWHEYLNKNYAPAMALASYVPVMIASDALKGLLQGGGQMPEWKKDWGPADYLGSGIERAGILGKLQFPIDGPGMLMGPTAQQALGVAKALDGGQGAGGQFVKALPASTLYSGWFGAGGDRTENSMSVD